MARDTARLTGRSVMPPFSMICPKCRKTFFKPGGGDTSCPECDSKMVSRDKSPTIFASDVKTRITKMDTDAKTEDTKKTEGPTKGTRAPRHNRS